MFGNHSIEWTIGSFAGSLIAQYAADHDVLLMPVKNKMGESMKAKVASFALWGPLSLGWLPLTPMLPIRPTRAQ